MKAMFLAIFLIAIFVLLLMVFYLYRFWRQQRRRRKKKEMARQRLMRIKEKQFLRSLEQYLRQIMDGEILWLEVYLRDSSRKRLTFTREWGRAGLRCQMESGIKPGDAARESVKTLTSPEEGAVWVREYFAENSVESITMRTSAQVAGAENE